MPTKAPADSAQMQRKTAVIDDIKARLESAGRRRAHRVPRPDRQRHRQPARRAAPRRHRLQDLQEHPRPPGRARRRSRRDRRRASRARSRSRSSAATAATPVTAAKALRDFARTNPNLVLKGGILGPRLLTSGDIEALADVPPRDQLLARLAGGFQAPMVKAAGLFQAFTRNMAYGVKALIDQRIEGGEALAAPEPEPERRAAARAEPETEPRDPRPRPQKRPSRRKHEPASTRR